MYLEADKSGFVGWMNRVKRDLPVEDQLAVDDDLVDLGYVANWQRAFAGAEVGQAAAAVSDTGSGLPHEFTTREAADVLHVSSRTVLRLVVEGVLRGRAVSPRKTLVTRASVLAYRQAVAS
ncbi:helix-turn-helix domain-containing protein [Modestobacter sp. Leaf380]|uniref:helix-turn-helix domain-containing protein n=1 Tax=Modestobacter sp. Leaf380 TaxID=1736356 RepID=UPI0012F9512D|nr:helix-turn-helix domain-containing protein [Modestobacter sp. Leaf380]